MRKIYLFLRYYPVVVPLWWYIGLMLFEFSLGGVGVARFMRVSAMSKGLKVMDGDN